MIVMPPYFKEQIWWNRMAVIDPILGVWGSQPAYLYRIMQQVPGAEGADEYLHVTDANATNRSLVVRQQKLCL